MLTQTFDIGFLSSFYLPRKMIITSLLNQGEKKRQFLYRKNNKNHSKDTKFV